MCTDLGMPWTRLHLFLKEINLDSPWLQIRIRTLRVSEKIKKIVSCKYLYVCKVSVAVDKVFKR